MVSFSRIALICIFGTVAYWAYGLQRAGYLNLPDIPYGAYPASFENGFRGIVYGMDVTDTNYAEVPKLFRRLSLANPDRRFLSLTYEVPPWFERHWSNCRPMTSEEVRQLQQTFTDDLKRDLQGARLDAICFIEVDGAEPILRGIIFSVPA